MGGDNYFEVSWAYNGADKFGLYSVDEGSTPNFGMWSYTLNKDVYNYYTNNDTIYFYSKICVATAVGMSGDVMVVDELGRLINSTINISELANTSDVDLALYNLDVDLQGQISAIHNSSSVSTSGSAITLDYFAHNSEIGSVKWMVHLDRAGTNARYSEITATYLPNSTVKFFETSTEDIGDTSDVTFSVTTNATNVMLKMTSTQVWDFLVKRINL